jgi:hypothetical protein
MKAKKKRAQMKIQEMSFMIIALFIFFTLVLLFYLAVSLNGLKNTSNVLSRQKNVLLIAMLAGTPEFSCADTKALCVDSDKILALKNHPVYSSFWDVDGLKIEKVYPKNDKTKDIECTYATYPNCDTFTLVENQSNSIADASFISLCRKEFKNYPYDKCELAKIIVWTQQK